MAKKLTDKQKAFCDEYLVDLNATQAAIRAGYSAKTAQPQSARLLLNVMVQQRIQELQAKRSERLEIKADRAVRELARIAFARITDICSFGPDGVKLKSSDEIDDDAIVAVAEAVETTAQSDQGPYCSSLRVKMHSKPQALSLLGRHLGLFVDKLALTDPEGERPLDFSALTDEQLEELCRRLAPQA